MSSGAATIEASGIYTRCTRGRLSSAGARGVLCGRDVIWELFIQGADQENTLQPPAATRPLKPDFLPSQQKVKSLLSLF